MTAYLRPLSLPDALAHLARAPSRILAGGTDVYPATQGQSLQGPILDITALPDLRGITQTADGLRIGAATTWAEIARANLPPALLSLQQAAKEVGGRQIQNAGTLGGNLCNASPAADGVPPLLTVEAQVEICREGASRLLPLSEFLLGPRKTALHSGELLTALHIPQSGLTGQSHFLKLGARAYLVISIAMVATRLTLENGQITGAALAVGACSATARRLPRVEAALLGQPAMAADSLIDPALVAEGLAPLDDLRASATYRAEAATELLRRCLNTTIQTARLQMDGGAA